MQPGEAYATRFSGAIELELENGDRQTVIDTSGVVGSIIDVRNPNRLAAGEYWIDEPQWAPVTAGDIGQVFGVALDDASPPNIYLTATAAFGLHRTPDGSAWMNGMWGQGGGPSTIYGLTATNGYASEIFTMIALNGRENTEAALRNIVFDAKNRQLLVSDLETGMIHRVSVEDGSLIGTYDHGVDGRASFFDAESGTTANLQSVPFDPASAARVTDCEDIFDSTPDCWNVADFRRRIWGLGVQTDAESGSTRLFYAVWGSAPLGSAGWEDAPQEQNNSIWSVGLTEGGRFNLQDVRCEFIVPDLGNEENPSQAAVSDIAFGPDGSMVLAERGGMRNLGLTEVNAFAKPHEVRDLSLLAEKMATGHLPAATRSGSMIGQMNLRRKSDPAHPVAMATRQTALSIHLRPAALSG